MMRAIAKRLTRKRKNQSFSSPVSQSQLVTPHANQSNSDACSAIEIVQYRSSDRPADQPIMSHIILLQTFKLSKIPEILEAEPVNSEETVFEIPSAYRQEQIPKKRSGARVASLDKILFTIAFLYLISVVAWLIDREKLQIPVAAAGDNIGVQLATLPSQPASSLTEVATESELSSPQTKDYVPVRPPSQLPSLAEPVVDKSTLPRIPVKQQNYTPVASAAALPPPPPLPPAISLPLPPPLPVKKAVVPPPPSPAPQKAAVPTLTPPSPAPQKTAAQPASPLSTPVLNHRLVGVLDLGARSAALFEVDGITHRVQVGEAIATSGWQLQSIASQEAVIGRQGERRSVLAGQKF